jgi:Tfp pilus assembly protein PilP
MRRARLALIALLLVSPASVARAQSPAPSPAAAQAAVTPAAPQGQTAPAPPAVAPAPPAAPEAYTYRTDGRRDPFLNLLGTGTEAKLTSRKGEGPTGLTIGEITVRGVMQSRGALVAMIQGPDNKTYLVHPGDKLLDGTIKTVMPQGLVIVQEVNDPLSLIKTREVRKLLRSLEDAKE